MIVLEALKLLLKSPQSFHSHSSAITVIKDNLKYTVTFIKNYVKNKLFFCYFTWSPINNQRTSAGHCNRYTCSSQYCVLESFQTWMHYLLKVI